MNCKVTSKEDLIRRSKEIVKEEGIVFLNMRKLALKCSISLGTIYNYFSSKEELISSTIQDIFKETMEESLFCFKKTSFIEVVSIFHEKLYTVSEEYNNFILDHSRIASKENRRVMDYYHEHVKKNLLRILNEDAEIDHSFFDDSLSKEDYVNFIFSNLIFYVIKKKDFKIVINLIQKTIYKKEQ